MTLKDKKKEWDENDNRVISPFYEEEDVKEAVLKFKSKLDNLCTKNKCDHSLWLDFDQIFGDFEEETLK